MILSTIIMAIGGFIDLVLDYLLIIGVEDFLGVNVPAMELTGVALATVISWFAMLFFMILLCVRENFFASNYSSASQHYQRLILKLFTLPCCYHACHCAL